MTLLIHRFIYCLHIVCSDQQYLASKSLLFASLPASSFDCIKRVRFDGNINTRKTDIQGNGSISAIFEHLDQIVMFSGYIVGGVAPSWGSAACSCISTLPGDTDGHECEELHIAASNRCKQHYTDRVITRSISTSSQSTIRFDLLVTWPLNKGGTVHLWRLNHSLDPESLQHPRWANQILLPASIWMDRRLGEERNHSWTSMENHVSGQGETTQMSYY